MEGRNERDHSGLQGSGKSAVNAPTQVGRGVHPVYHVGTTTTEDAVWIKKCALGRPKLHQAARHVFVINKTHVRRNVLCKHGVVRPRQCLQYAVPNYKAT